MHLGTSNARPAEAALGMFVASGVVAPENKTVLALRVLSWLMTALFLVDGLAVSQTSQTGGADNASKNSGGNQTSLVEVLELKSKTFHNTRAVRVLLPPGYRDEVNASKRYTVLYPNDGSVYFEPTAMDVTTVVPDMIQKWAIPPVIVVGIDSAALAKKVKNQELDRADEYIPYPDTGFPPDHILSPAEVPNPHGKLYPQFLVGEVMPLINLRYRTLTGPQNTGLGGYSYGGVAALYTAMTKPGVIGRLLLESTPLWVGPDNQLLKETQKIKQWPHAVYIGLGSKEGPDEAINKESQKNQQALGAAITATSPQTRLKLVLEEGAGHRPPAWHRRLPEALSFLWQ